jgi:hypothetical protein
VVFHKREFIKRVIEEFRRKEDSSSYSTPITFNRVMKKEKEEVKDAVILHNMTSVSMR